MEAEGDVAGSSFCRSVLACSKVWALVRVSFVLCFVIDDGDDVLRHYEKMSGSRRVSAQRFEKTQRTSGRVYRFRIPWRLWHKN